MEAWVKWLFEWRFFFVHDRVYVQIEKIGESNYIGLYTEKATRYILFSILLHHIIIIFTNTDVRKDEVEQWS